MLLDCLQTKMKILQVLAALLLLLQTAAASSCKEITYFLAVTSQPVADTTETLCVQLCPAGKTLALVVTLEHIEQSKILLTHNGIKQDYYQCVPFKVPDMIVDSEAFIKVQISGGSKILNKTTNILIKPKTQLTIIQTDKPVYKPGQTVKFRIFSLDSTFLTYNQLFPTIELKDPNSNRIGQWLNVPTINGILDLSYPINDEARLGAYTITAWNERNEQTSQDFKIRNYALPQFEVFVQVPPVVTILDTQAALKVCANYTYGKAVDGSVTAVVCRQNSTRPGNGTSPALKICRTYSMTTDIYGCGSTVLKLEQFELNNPDYEDTITIECEVEENDTGMVLNGYSNISVTSDIVYMAFEDAPQAFKRGMSYKGKIRATFPDSSPVKNKPVYLTVKYGRNENVTLTLVTDNSGIAPFSLKTLLWGSEEVSLEASFTNLDEEPDNTSNVRRPNYPSAFALIQPFHSKSNSFLELQPPSGSFSCDKNAVVEAQYSIYGDDITQGGSLDFYYLVMSKGSLAQYGSLSVTFWRKTVNKGKLSFLLKHISTLAPVAQVVVYTILQSGEVVADSRDFPVQLCFTNKVSLAFSSSSGLPGGQTSLVLKAQPGSLCSVKAMDQSLLLLKPEKELKAESIFSLLPTQKLSGYPFSIYEDDPCVDVKTEQQNPRFKLLINRKLEAYDVFRLIGVKILTNAKVRSPFNCSKLVLPRSAAPKVRLPLIPIRTIIPDTWIWDLVPVGSSGAMGVRKTIPDTITTWSAGAFCTSSVGFGLASKVKFITIQPLVVNMIMPDSIIRGEMFTLKASVFNNLTGCILVKVTLQQTQLFLVDPCVGCNYTRNLCDDESWTFTWNVWPTALGELTFNVSAEALPSTWQCGNKSFSIPQEGRIDSLVQTLLVEAEGSKESSTYNELLCPTGAAVEMDVSVGLPEVYVDGSISASVSVLGDFMGQTLRNLDNLLDMPFGCGEQNMLLFAPSVQMLHYLKSSDQLTSEIIDKTSTFLVNGYQRQLEYKHDDGSYSAFGFGDPSGDTWLTAFVMKSLASAKHFIFIDEQHVKQAKAWLGLQQQSDGCFPSAGQVFYSDLKAGANGGHVTLTAFITAALLEIGTPTKDPMVHNSLIFLRNAVPQLTSTYTTALLSYTFTLAGDQSMRTSLLNMLDTKVIVTAHGRYWSRDNTENVVDSLEIQMTSYVLLALLSGYQLPNFNMDYIASIGRWLILQQNAFGGFFSTQDTVVALQALAKYSAVSYSPLSTIAVTVTAPSGSKKFTISESNRLLVQEFSLHDLFGDYKIKAEGNGCVFAQFTVHYTTPPPADYSFFHISAQTDGQCLSKSTSVELSITVGYNGRRPQTNMVIIEVKLLSGFSLAAWSLNASNIANDTSALNEGTVKRVDQIGGTIVMYLDGLKNGPHKTYRLVILQDVVVQNLKPATIKVYDYYETNEKAVTDYSSPCSWSYS